MNRCGEAITCWWLVVPERLRDAEGRNRRSAGRRRPRPCDRGCTGGKSIPRGECAITLHQRRGLVGQFGLRLWVDLRPSAFRRPSGRADIRLRQGQADSACRLRVGCPRKALDKIRYQE